MEINAIIVEDEEKGAVVLQMLLGKYCKDIRITGVAHNIEDAQKLLATTTPHVLFLDIELNGRDSFELLEKLPVISFHIIFVTAYKDYAIKAIKFSALDYLLKPVSIPELQKAIEKVQAKLSITQSSQVKVLQENVSGENAFSKIVLCSIDEYYPVLVRDIIYCKADDSYTHFFLANEKHYVVAKLLKEYDLLLAPHNFFRIHKSYLINMDHIQKVTKQDGLTVVMSDGTELIVSLRKKEDFLHAFRSY